MLNLKHIYLLNKVTNTYSMRVSLFNTRTRKATCHSVMETVEKASIIVNSFSVNDFAQPLSKLILVLNHK